MSTKNLRITGIIAFAALFAGCASDPGELRRENADLRIAQDSLLTEAADRDAYIDEVTQAINDIYSSMEMMRSKERIVLKGTEEAQRGVSGAGMKRDLMDRIAEIHSTLESNRARLEDLQAKLKADEKRSAGFRDMVATLRRTLEEREQSIAALTARVGELETGIASRDARINQQSTLIGQQSGIISDQNTRLNTGYYIVGKEDDLEKKGIISEEGGFLWGLLGSTTVLSSGVTPAPFRTIDKTRDHVLEVNGEIEQVIPKRNPEYYTMSMDANKHTVLRITNPERFWSDPYLVLVVD
jgi:hypothetical protein